jgi:HEPN domain-containing protein
VNAPDLIRYRLRLAEGFLREAEQDFALERWRSCVDNAQLATENAGKAVITLFGSSAKTHDPAQQVARIVRSADLSPSMRSLLEKMIPDLLALGSAEHFLTDYGDEVALRLPWDLFDKGAASEALDAGRRSIDSAQRVVHAWTAEA